MDFQVNGSQYRSGKLNAFQQFHVVRRLTPVLQSLGALQKLKTDPFAAVGEIGQALARMPDADVDYVLQTCLGVVHRQQGNTYVRLLPNGGVLAFDDVDLMAMNEIVLSVLKDNLGSFFDGIASRFTAPPTSPSNP